MFFATRLFLERLFRKTVTNRVEAFAISGFSLVCSQVKREALAFRLNLVYLLKFLPLDYPLRFAIEKHLFPAAGENTLACFFYISFHSPPRPIAIESHNMQ